MQIAGGVDRHRLVGHHRELDHRSPVDRQALALTAVLGLQIDKADVVLL